MGMLAVAAPLGDSDLWGNSRQQAHNPSQQHTWLPAGFHAAAHQPDFRTEWRATTQHTNPDSEPAGGEDAALDGIDCYDVNAATVSDWHAAVAYWQDHRVSPTEGHQAHTGVTSFLPEGSPITPAEARYTVDPATLMPMGDHPQATAAEKAEMRDLCHEFQAPGFSYDLKDLPGFRSMKVQLKMISDQNAFTRQHGQRNNHDNKKIVARRDKEGQDRRSKETVGIRVGGQRSPHHQQPYSSGSDSRFRDGQQK